MGVCTLQEKVQDNQWLRTKVLNSLKAEVSPVATVDAATILTCC